MGLFKSNHLCFLAHALHSLQYKVNINFKDAVAHAGWLQIAFESLTLATLPITVESTTRTSTSNDHVFIH